MIVLARNAACRCVAPPTSAIWLEASDASLEAASTLAHIAVANHYGNGLLWQQAMLERCSPVRRAQEHTSCAVTRVSVARNVCTAVCVPQWLELEEMRGDVESLLRLRALASAAGVLR